MQINKNMTCVHTEISLVTIEVPLSSSFFYIGEIIMKIKNRKWLVSLILKKDESVLAEEDIELRTKEVLRNEFSARVPFIKVIDISDDRDEEENN